MRSKLIIDGNAVYEVDEDCMLKRSREELRDMDWNFKGQTAEKKEKRRKERAEE